MYTAYISIADSQSHRICGSCANMKHRGERSCASQTLAKNNNKAAQ